MATVIDDRFPADVTLLGLVGRRAPLDELPRWKQYLSWAVFFLLGWYPGDGIEVITIKTNPEEAKALANQPGYFYVTVPLDCTLPEEPVPFGVEFPASKASLKYANRGSDLVLVHRRDLHQLAVIDQQVTKLVDSLTT